MSGLVKMTSGTVTLDGVNLASYPPYRIPELGIAHVPEGRQVFPDMTVNENLEIGSYVPKAKAERQQTLDLVYSIFPRLAERQKQLAGTMSGGEQQMLAVGRGLMLKPRLLMLDEPSLGLAPVMTDVTFEKIGEIHKMGTAILLVEQNVSRALSLVQRAYVLESGRVIMTAPAPNSLTTSRYRRRIWGFEYYRRLRSGAEFPLPLWERVGERGSGLSKEPNPSPGSHLTLRSDLSRKGTR